MSKNAKVEKGLETLQALVAPEPTSDTINFALRTLMDTPEYAVADQAAALLEDAAKDSEFVKQAEGEIGDRAILFTELKARIHKLQLSLITFHANLVTKILNSEQVTYQRKLWEGQFSKRLEEVVQASIQQDPGATQVREELKDLVAQANAAQKANEQAKVLITESKERAQRLSKEASELLASIA